MSSVSSVPRENITQNYQPRTNFNLTQGTSSTNGANGSQQTDGTQGTGTSQQTAGASRTGQPPLILAQSTGGAQAQAPINPGSYTFYLERGDKTFPAGSPLAGQDVGKVAQENAQRLQSAMAPRLEVVDQTLQRVQADPSFSPAARSTIESGLKNSQRDLRNAQQNLERASETYTQHPNSPEARRGLAQASQDAQKVLAHSEATVHSGQRELTANANYRNNQAQQQVAHQARGETVYTTVTQATNAATTSGNPQQTLAAADQILSLRTSDSSRTSTDALPGGVDNRRVTWNTGSTPLATVAGQVQTLHGQNASGRDTRVQQLETRAQELEKQSPGSIRTPGSQAWEMANLATTLKAAGQQSDGANTTLGRTMSETAGGVGRNTVNPLEFQTSRAAEAVAFEARVQHDADKALSGPAESRSTNLAQAQARVATMADTMANPGAADLHGRAMVEVQGQTMRDVFAGRRDELRELDKQLAAEQRTGGPAAGQPGSRAGEIQVLRTAIGQEMHRLDKASGDVTERFTDSPQSWNRQTSNIAQEAEGRSLRHSDGLQRHAEAVLGGGTGVGNAAVMSAVPEQRTGEILNPNASAVWLQGRDTQQKLETGRQQVEDLPSLAGQMPTEATGKGGRFDTARIDQALTSSAESLTNIDRRLDRLETGRAGDGEMTEAQRALTNAQGQINRVDELGKKRETIVSQLQESATIAQSNPGLQALREDTLKRADNLAAGVPEGDLEKLNKFTDDADKFISQRQTELNDRIQRNGDPDGRIGKELKSLDDARTQITEAQNSLRAANAKIGSNDAQAGHDMFGAEVNLRLASSILKDSVSNVRSEPR